VLTISFLARSALPLPNFVASLTWFLTVHVIAVAALIVFGLMMQAGPISQPAHADKGKLELRPSQP
jgi:hypothetical protein